MAAVRCSPKTRASRARIILLRVFMMAMLPLVVSLFAIQAAQAVPPGEIVWSRMYADPAGGDDFATCVALAPDGTVRTASSWGVPAFGIPFALMVRKHSASGQEIWSQPWIPIAGAGARPISTAVDRWGNCYVAGDTSTQVVPGDPFLLKFAPDGALEWFVTYDGPVGGAETATQVLVDSDGNAYVAGTGEIGGGSKAMVLLKYAPDSSLRWEYLWGGPGGAGCFAATMDSARNVFLTGGSSTATSEDCVSLKVTSAGKAGWAKRFKSPGGGVSFGTAMAAGNHGEIVVVGVVAFSIADHRWLTLRYAGGSGTLTWSRVADVKGTGVDWPAAVKVSSAGDIYVAGTAPSSGLASQDMVLRRYSPSGTQRWAKRYGGGPGTSTFVRDMARDSSGDLYILAAGAPHAAPDCYVVARFRSDGSRRWATTWKGPGPDSDEPAGIAATGSGAVYVVGGASPPSGGQDEIIMRIQR